MKNGTVVQYHGVSLKQLVIGLCLQVFHNLPLCSAISSGLI